MESVPSTHSLPWMHHRTLKYVSGGCLRVKNHFTGCELLLFLQFTLSCTKARPKSGSWHWQYRVNFRRKHVSWSSENMGKLPHISSSTCIPTLKEFCHGGCDSTSSCSRRDLWSPKILRCVCVWWGRILSSNLSWKAGFSREWIKLPLFWFSFCPAA